MLTQLEKKHGTPEALDALLRKATTFCPKVRVFTWPFTACSVLCWSSDVLLRNASASKMTCPKHQ